MFSPHHICWRIAEAEAALAGFPVIEPAHFWIGVCKAVGSRRKISRPKRQDPREEEEECRAIAEEARELMDGGPRTRLSGLEGADAVDFLAVFVLGEFEIVMELEAEEESGGHTKKAGKSEIMDGGNTAFAVLHFRDVAGDDAAGGGEIFLAKSESGQVSHFNIWGVRACGGSTTS